MCSAVTGVTNCLHPHRHKGVCIHQRCIMGVTLQRVFAPFQGGVLTAHHESFFFYKYCSVYWTTLCLSPALFRCSRTLSAHWRSTYSTPISYFCKGKLRQGLDCVLATCSAMAWVTPLQGGPPPPPWHKEGCTAQCCAMGCATAKSFPPLFRGRYPDSTRLICMFYPCQLSVQSTKITLCSPTPIQFPKNPVSLLTIYPGSYCTFCQGKPGQGLQLLRHYFFVLICEMMNLSSNFFISQTFSWHWQKTPNSFENTLMW
jgi:hypothetical protein